MKLQGDSTKCKFSIKEYHSVLDVSQPCFAYVLYLWETLRQDSHGEQQGKQKVTEKQKVD